MSQLALRLIEENIKTKATLLDLGYCGLTEVPEEIQELVWLEELILSNEWSEYDMEKKKREKKQSSNNRQANQIASIEGLEKLTSLKKVILAGHGYDWPLTDLSPLSHLTSLQEIDCSGNPISDLRPLEGLSNLLRLYCSGTKISDLSPLSKLTKIQHLSCSSTPVKDLSPLADLVNLKRLVCYSTRVDDLSPLAKLVNLQQLACNDTPVNNLLPIANLTSLEQFACYSTQVSDLSPILPFMEKGIRIVFKGTARIGEFTFDNCPLVNPPIEIVEQGNEAILNYFREKEQQGTVKGCEAKMLLVGQGGSGKTSLMRRLYQVNKPLPDEKETTKGIEIHRHDFKMADGSDFRLNVWDFGGQEIYHATHQFFLTKRSLYVLLDDTRQDHMNVHDDGFKYWLEAIDLFGGGSPVLIFQNEKGNRSKQIDIGGIKGKFDNVQGVWTGNLEFPGTANKLREAVELHAKNLPLVGMELPAKWVSIRAELEELAKTHPYITQQEYFEVYGRHLDLDRTKAMHLSQYLHDLGVFLHFQDDSLLTRILILQNSWATEAVFKMLDDETVKGNLGRFTEADCKRVWVDSTWADMHPELLALMQKFELCYVLPDARPKTWLVPQLLPPSKPLELADWAQPGDLVQRYQYEFLPKGLVSRLMVRQHRFVPRPEMSWTSGVLFERDGSQVLIEIPAKGGEIVLRARGHERKELLSVIASELDALNETFHGLPERIKKYIPCNCKTCQTLPEPEFFEQKRLQQRKKDGKLKVECPGSYEEVDVLELLDGLSIGKLPNWAKHNAGTVIDKAHILKIISTGQLEKALEEMEPLYPEASELLRQYRFIIKEYYSTRVDIKEYTKVLALISSGAMNLLK